MAFSLPERWPGDTRPLWRRALDKREDMMRAAKAIALSDLKRVCGAKGGKAVKPTHFPRKYQEVKVGDRFGAWTVISIIGRGHRGRSDIRVHLRCSCGKRKDVYEFAARQQRGTCPHAARVA